MTLCALEDILAELHQSSKEEDDEEVKYRRGMRNEYRRGSRIRYKDDDWDDEEMYHMNRRNYRSVA